MLLINKTKSICPECIKKLDADIVQDNNQVYMLKKCKKHGNFRILLSKDPAYYKEIFGAQCP